MLDNKFLDLDNKFLDNKLIFSGIKPQSKKSSKIN